MFLTARGPAEGTCTSHCQDAQQARQAQAARSTPGSPASSHSVHGSNHASKGTSAPAAGSSGPQGTARRPPWHPPATPLPEWQGIAARSDVCRSRKKLVQAHNSRLQIPFAATPSQSPEGLIQAGFRRSLLLFRPVMQPSSSARTTCGVATSCPLASQVQHRRACASPDNRMPRARPLDCCCWKFPDARALSTHLGGVHIAAAGAVHHIYDLQQVAAGHTDSLHYSCHPCRAAGATHHSDHATLTDAML